MLSCSSVNLKIWLYDLFIRLFYAYFNVIKGIEFMKMTLSGLRIVLVSVAVLMMGATTAISAPEKATISKNAATAPRPMQNKALDFVLTNATGYRIAGVYLSPTSEDNWGENILSEELGDGDSVQIQFSPDAEATKWDLRADWAMEDGADQEFVYWTGLSLDEINKLTLKYNKSTDTTSASIE
jgi:hypothetical protein